MQGVPDGAQRGPGTLLKVSSPVRHPVRGVLRPGALRVHAGGRDDGAAAALPHLGVDIKVILTPPCIFCIEN
jgi:hypothetical protein